MTPDFEELVGAELAPEERARLRRAHDLLVAAGPLPELPPALADPSQPPEAEIVPFWNRRRNATIAVLAAAIASAAFGIGYLTGDRGGGKFSSEATIVMRGTSAAPAGAVGSIALGSRDDAGNWPMLVRISNLDKVPRGAYYTLWLTKKGRARAPCGSFIVRGGDKTTEVTFTVAYTRSDFDGWVVTLQHRGERTPGRVLLKTV